ncbi:MAG: magnesium/cobalt transporter CorA [Planctomycetes bacterium]|nr:magnesium/cobalt transporter CorA [Planctomycetota bacterium]
MPRRRRHHGLPTNPGMSPGSLVIPEVAPRPRVRVVRYDATRIEARDHVSPAEVQRLAEAPEATWIDIEGYGDRGLFEFLEAKLAVPRLALEDVLGNNSRPKLEVIGDALFVVARAMKSGEHPESEQLSIFVRGTTVITFSDEPLDLLAPLRQRLHQPESLTRRSGADFLVYRILDCVVDSYTPCLERLGARLEAVEVEAIARPSSKPLTTLYELMRDLRMLTRIALPMRELAVALGHEARGFFRPDTLPYLSDLREHTQSVVELSAHYRDLGTDVRELIHGALNLRMNQVMRFMTAITTVFIPLSFVTGLYGMNFEYMPETRWPYGYFFALGLLATIALFTLRWLRAQGWTRVNEDE